MSINIAVLGASGFSGTELIKILSAHPEATLAALGGESKAGMHLAQIDSSVQGLDLPLLEKLDVSIIAARAQLVFLALPHTESMKWAPALLEKGLKVIDLSGDFRLQDISAYESFYKTPHLAPQKVSQAVYGLPELNRKAIKGASFVANPGCYPTVSALALLPLVAEPGLIDDASIIIDAKSGYSGGGRKLASGEARQSVRNNFSAYKIGGVHQHLPEIEQTLSQAAGRSLKVSFTPHLLDVERGILVTAYVSLKKETSAVDLRALYLEHYKNEAFVHIEDEGKLPDLKQVRQSNDCRIGLSVDRRVGRAVIVAVEDNLGKGAAGQAVQNMNLMLGLDETMGLCSIKSSS